MEMKSISDPHDRPRCIGADAQGRRCRELVAWDEATARPLSTRCQAHGGLVDAALMSCQSLDLADMPDTANAGTGASDDLDSSPETLPTKRLSGILGGLPALILAGALCVFMAGPALADFESAVTAYDRGDYTEARSEFQSLAAAGDQRAARYIDRIRDKLPDGQQTDETSITTLMDSISSFFSESETSSDGARSGAIVTDAGSSTATRSLESASGGKPAD